MDLLGLCAIALAVYLGYVLYLGWNGGTVGNGAETALRTRSAGEPSCSRSPSPCSGSA